MTPIELVSAVESGTRADSLLKASCEEGTSAAFFGRVVELMGSNSEMALSLGSSWQSFAKYGDQPGYAFRVKGAIERLRGQWLKSASSFEKAAELSRDPAFAVGAIDSYARGGQIEKAIATGKSLVKRLKRSKRYDIAARAQLNLGNAYLWADRYAEARKAYQSALPNLAAVDAASAKLGLSTCEIFGGSLRKAESLLNEANEALASLELTAFMGEATVNRAHIAILSGRPEDGLDLLNAMRKSGAKATWARIEEFMGDAYLRLNLFEDAESAYREALTLNPSRLNAANAQFGVGQALLAAGQFEEAIRELRKAASAYRRLGNGAWQWAAQTAIAEALRNQGSAKSAGMARKAAIQLRRLDSPYHEATAWLVAGENHRRAKYLVDKHGGVSLLWQVHALEALNAKSPLRAYRRMLEAMLMARLETRSYGSRMSFLRDKENALRRYLGVLLETPNRARVSEALSVVQQTRAITLLDEIASAHLGGSSKWAENLEAVREKLRTDEPEIPGAPTRRKEMRPIPRGIASGLLTPLLRGVPKANPSVSVLIETADSIHVLSEAGNRRIQIRESELEDRLRWLSFDMLEPILKPNSDPKRVMAAIAELRCQLGLFQGKLLCPDRTTWRIPWQLLTEHEIALALSPSFCSTAHEWKLPVKPRVAIWVASTVGLPHAMQEISTLRELFPKATLVDSLNRALDLKGHYDLLHVVGHARLNEENPMYSSIQFEDGDLMAIEIARSNFSVGLAVLAACDTGRLDSAFPGEPDGLVRAFLARKAEAVVASGWQWDDEAASLFVASLYAALNEGRDLGAAMASARASCRERKPHPFYWGAPILFAGYGTDASNGARKA